MINSSAAEVACVYTNKLSPAAGHHGRFIFARRRLQYVVDDDGVKTMLGRWRQGSACCAARAPLVPDSSSVQGHL